MPSTMDWVFGILRWSSPSVILALWLVVGAAGGDDSAYGAPNEVRIDPAVATTATGDSVEVDVLAESPLTGLREWRLTVKYDPSLLVPVACRPFSIPSVGFETCNTEFGPDTVGILGTPRQDLFGVQTLARIRFAAIGTTGTQSELRIDITTFKDSAGNETNPGIANGSVHIEGTGTNAIITGLVYEDENEDGTRDSAEPGLFFRNVSLIYAYDVAHAATDDAGAYIFADLEAGNYDLTVFPSVEIPGLCAETPPGFDPLLLLGCIGGGIIPWRSTTPDHVSVTIGAGSVNRIDFGAKRLDVQSIFGRSLLQDNYPPEGTLIEPLVNGQQCGATTTGPSGEFDQFFIFGDGERPGCARPGDVVRFTVGGMPSAEEFIWEEDGWHFGPRQFGLTAIQDYAWYWAEEAFNPAAIGMTVTVSVYGSSCGQAIIAQATEGFAPVTPPIGFHRLVVPSNAISVGCGRLGGSVTFTVGDLKTTATWEPGLHKLELPFDQILPTPTPSVAPTQTPETSAAATSTLSAALTSTPSAAATPAALPLSGGRQGVSALQYSVIIIILAAPALALTASIAAWYRLRKEP